MAYLQYEKARDYCQNPVEGGQSDWMLPGISEMNSIATDLQAIGIIPGLNTKRLYWSSTVSGTYHQTVRIGSGVQYPLGWAELEASCARRIFLNN